MLAWSLATLLPVALWGAAPSRPAGIVFFMIDTLRADHVHCLGYPRPTTPALDALAARGTLFTNAVSQSNFSLPSYATLLTSRYPTSHGLFNIARALEPGSPALAGTLADHGFATAAFTGGGHLLPAFGLERGFATYKSTQFLESLYRTVPPAIQWLDGVGDRPFFLLLHGYDCHAPYTAPLGLAEQYDPAYDGVVHHPGFLWPAHLDKLFGLSYDPCALEDFARNPLLQLAGVAAHRRALLPAGSAWPMAPVTSGDCRRLPPVPAESRPAIPFPVPRQYVELEPPDVRHLIAHYDGTVTYADTWLGIFVEALRRRGLLERTLLVVSGDHGESLGENRGLPAEDGRFGHGWSLVDWQIHVPLAIAGPGVAAGRRVTDAVELIDLAPTVLELCGLSPDRRHQGESLAAQLRPGAAPASDPERPAFSCSLDQVTVRTARWQLMRGEAEGADSWRLYDLESDPLERRDMSARRPETAALLRSKLLDWLERTVPAGRPGRSRLDPQRRDAFRTFGYW